MNNINELDSEIAQTVKDIMSYSDMTLDKRITLGLAMFFYKGMAFQLEEIKKQQEEKLNLMLTDTAKIYDDKR